MKLSHKVKEKVDKLFRLIDVDDSKTINRDRTFKFWPSNFAKINSRVLFDQFDENNDGSIHMKNGLILANGL